MESPKDLSFVYEGWEGYNRSLKNAIAPLTPAQLEFRATLEMRSVGGISWHIGEGRVERFRRISAPGHTELSKEMEGREAEPADAERIVDWLDRTWQMVQATLDQWTVDDLPVSYEHPYQGKVYSVSRQWTIWRIMANDIHHGGQ